MAEGTLFVRQGKGKKDRVVPVAGRAAAALAVYLEEGRLEHARDGRRQALFLSVHGRPINSTTIQALVRQHAKAAGLSVKVSPHTLRHTCATHLLRGGADIRHVQKLLGHSSIQSTERYTRVVPQGPRPRDEEGAPSRKDPEEAQQAVESRARCSLRPRGAMSLPLIP